MALHKSNEQVRHNLMKGVPGNSEFGCMGSQKILNLEVGVTSVMKCLYLDATVEFEEIWNRGVCEKSENFG